MLSLIAAVGIFGNYKDWNSTTTMILLIVIQAIFAIAIVTLVIYLIMLSKRKPTVVVQEVAAAAPQEAPEPQVIYVQEPKEEVERMLAGISLDLGVVQRQFAVGEQFNCDGLVVRAEYNVEPLTESFSTYQLVDINTYLELEKSNQVYGVYVIYPDMSEVGKKYVNVKYAHLQDMYAIEVGEVVEEQTEEATKSQRNATIVEEDSVDTRLRYDRSFTARLIQSEDEVKYWYTDLKNMLLGYKGVRERMSWKRETYKCGREMIAKLAYRGKTLCVFLPLNPQDFADETTVESVSDATSYDDTPLLIRLKSSRRVKLAKKLIKQIMDQKHIKQVPREAVDYYMPYEGVLDLIHKGLIRRDIKTAEQEAIFDKDKGKDTDQSENDDTFALEEVSPGIFVTKK